MKAQQYLVTILLAAAMVVSATGCNMTAEDVPVRTTTVDVHLDSGSTPGNDQNTDHTPSRLGINLNYLTDGRLLEYGEQSSLKAVLTMQPAMLRYPGGEKSQAFLWNYPAEKRPPEPVLARQGSTEWPSADPNWVEPFEGQKYGQQFRHDILNFDALMQAVTTPPIDTEVIAVINLDSLYKPAEPGGWVPDRAELIAAAADWVRYANIEQDYNIRYWELGNETDYGPDVSYNGNTGDPERYAQDVLDFAQAMRAEDDSILIGANGSSRQWFETLLEIAGDQIDFLAVHEYIGWQWDGYSTYVDDRSKLLNAITATDAARQAVAEYAPEHADRIEIGLTEMNVIDWSWPDNPAGWTHHQNFGQAVVLADYIGQLTATSTAPDFALFWNTRWVEAVSPGDDLLVWDSLAPDNTVTLVGEVLKAWGAATPGYPLTVDYEFPVVGYAVQGAQSDDEYGVLLLNTGMEVIDLTLQLHGAASNIAAAGVNQPVTSIAGEHPDRPEYELRELQFDVEESQILLELPPYSITTLLLGS